MRKSIGLSFLIGNISLQATYSIVASPNPFPLYDEDGTFLGYVHVRGGDVNHWVEDPDGYTLCGIDGTTQIHERHLLPKEERHKHQSRVHQGEKVVREYEPTEVPANTTGTGGNHTHYYYCAQTPDGNVVPNTDYPVATTDPNLVSNDTLPAHVHPTERRAVHECGDYCIEEVHEGAGNTRRLEAFQVQTTGFLPNLVVTFRFSDHRYKELPSTEDLEILMNSQEAVPGIAPTGGVKQVFLDNSNGKFELHSTVTHWVTLDKKYTESYCAANQSGLGIILHECLHNALSKVDPFVDFASFNTNGDDYIDSIAFLHSGYGAEHTNNFGHIWSHKWRFKEEVNGERVDMEWTSHEGIKVLAYHISPALWGYWGNEIGRVGVIAHETAHFLGLDDLYDNEIGHGIGYWSMMANAWGFDRSQKYPPFLDPFSKGELGWANFTELTEPENGIVVTPSYTSHTYYKITRGFPHGEYLIIENRQPEGFDERISQAGLLIWHIDNLKENNREEGYPGQPGWPENNKHYKVALLGADGSYHLEKGSNPGDVGDVFYEGGVTSLGSSTDVFPNTAAYQNGTIVETGIQIKNIRSDGENMLFDLCFHDVCASDEEDEDEDEPASADTYYTGCELVPGWTDTYDDNCLWYEEHEPEGCPNEGSVEGTDGVEAWDACCHCNEGTRL